MYVIIGLSMLVGGRGDGGEGGSCLDMSVNIGVVLGVDGAC